MNDNHLIRITKKALSIFGVLLFLGFTIDTGGTRPSDNAVVYIDDNLEFFYPPHHIPDTKKYHATAYVLAKRMGAKRYKSDAFNIDGPPLVIEFAISIGLISSWPSYWLGSNQPVEYFNNDLVEKQLQDYDNPYKELFK